MEFFCLALYVYRCVKFTQRSTLQIQALWPFVMDRWKCCQCTDFKSVAQDFILAFFTCQIPGIQSDHYKSSEGQQVGNIANITTKSIKRTTGSKMQK